MAHVVAVQELPAEADCGVHAATPFGPLTVGVGQVVAVHWLADVAAAAEQLAAPTLVLLLLQVVAVH